MAPSAQALAVHRMEPHPEQAERKPRKEGSDPAPHAKPPVARERHCGQEKRRAKVEEQQDHDSRQLQQSDEFYFERLHILLRSGCDTRLLHSFSADFNAKAVIPATFTRREWGAIIE